MLSSKLQSASATIITAIPLFQCSIPHINSYWCSEQNSKNNHFVFNLSENVRQSIKMKCVLSHTFLFSQLEERYPETGSLNTQQVSDYMRWNEIVHNSLNAVTQVSELTVGQCQERKAYRRPTECFIIHSFITSRRQHKKHTSIQTSRPKHKHST